tara:strand:+ start:8022 stop:8966 length:945 start_codon:yes stop_codon:yes gene_type:complete
MKIAYYPPSSKENLFSENMIGCLSELGDVYEVTPRRLVNFIKFSRYDVAVVNWIESKVIKSNGDFSLFKFTFFVAWFHILKFFSKKIIYVKHNNFPHGVSSVDSGLRIVRYFESRSDKVVVLIPQLGANFVPHPLYSDLSNRKCTSRDAAPYAVFFGRIEKYKNLDKLISAWPELMRLVIAGPCNNAVYLEYLRNLGTGKDINIIGRYLSEDEASELVGGAYVLVNPASEGSAIVSGSAMYALSMGVPVVGVHTPFMSFMEELGYGVPVNSLEEIDSDFLHEVRSGSVLISRGAVNEIFGQKMIVDRWKEVIYG